MEGTQVESWHREGLRDSCQEPLLERMRDHWRRVAMSPEADVGCRSGTPPSESSEEIYCANTVLELDRLAVPRKRGFE